MQAAGDFRSPNVWVGDLTVKSSFKEQKELLTRAFEAFGDINSVFVKESPKGRIAFVNFSSDVNAENAARKMNNARLLDGSRIITKYNEGSSSSSPQTRTIPAQTRSSSSGTKWNSINYNNQHNNNNNNYNNNNNNSELKSNDVSTDRPRYHREVAANPTTRSPKVGATTSKTSSTTWERVPHSKSPIKSTSVQDLTQNVTKPLATSIELSSAKFIYLSKDKETLQEIEDLSGKINKHGIEIKETDADKLKKKSQAILNILTSRLHTEQVKVPYYGRELEIFKAEAIFRAEKMNKKNGDDSFCVVAEVSKDDQTNETTIEIVCKNANTAKDIKSSLTSITLTKEVKHYTDEEIAKLFQDSFKLRRIVEELAIKKRVIVSPSLDDANSLVFSTFAYSKSNKKFHHELKQYLKQDDIVTKMLDLQQLSVKFLFYCEQSWIKELDSECMVSVRFEELEGKGLIIKVEGVAKKVEWAIERIDKKLSTLIVQKIEATGPRWDFTGPILKEQRNQLMEKHRVLILLPAPRTRQVSVAGLYKTHVDGAVDAINKLLNGFSIKEVSFDEEQHAKLYMHLMKSNKKDELEKEWQVKIDAPLKENNIKISGASEQSVNAVEELLRSFLKSKEETLTSSGLTWKDPLIKLIFQSQKFKQDAISNIEGKFNTKLIMVDDGELRIKGLHENVDKCKQKLEELQDNLISQLKREVLFSTDDASKNGDSKYNMKVRIIAKNYEDLNRVLEKHLVRVEKPSSTSKVAYRYLHKIQDSSPVLFEVRLSSIVTQRVDAIVNAANPNLDHAGGVASAISDAAGKSLQDDCNKFIAKYGSLYTSQCFLSDAGKLPSKHVIHAVGPRWSNSLSGSVSRQQLKITVKNIILKSEELKLSSIAIPALCKY